jgi:hypothetical protein
MMTKRNRNILLAIVLSVLLRYTDSYYPFGIFKLFWTSMSRPWAARSKTSVIMNHITLALHSLELLVQRYQWPKEYFDSFLSSSLPIYNFKAMHHRICSLHDYLPSCWHVGTGPNSYVRFDCTHLKLNKCIFDISIPFCHHLYLSATLKQCFTEFAVYSTTFHHVQHLICKSDLPIWSLINIFLIFRFLFVIIFTYLQL